MSILETIRDSLVFFIFCIVVYYVILFIGVGMNDHLP